MENGETTDGLAPKEKGLGLVPKARRESYHTGTNLVLLDPDVRKAFRTERAVNDALRLVTELRKTGSYKRRDYSSNGA